ncbi:ribokinase [Thalassospira sp. MA62]|nr:ribokinase [Thalassospira sp. MA62]
MDFTMRVGALPVPGQTVLAQDFQCSPGGKGCNQAIAAKRLGHRPVLISKIGDDDFGQDLLDNLQAEGLDTQHIIIAEAARTGTAMISIDPSGQNTVAVAGGANMILTRNDLHDRRHILRDCSYLLLQLECPVLAVDCAMKYAREGQAKIILDPSPVSDRIVMRDLLSLTDIVTPDRHACHTLTGIDPTDHHSAARAAKYLHDMGPETVILKMGQLGAFYSSHEQHDLVPAFAVTALDMVGEGDCFNAALAVALTDGQEIGDAVRFACATAALSTTRSGAASSAPCLDEVLDLLETQPERPSPTCPIIGIRSAQSDHQNIP